MVVADFDGIAVALVPWPSEAEVATELAEAGRPRLLLVVREADPPDVSDELEDWIRVPADERDVEVRARRLARLAGGRRSSEGGVGSAARPRTVITSAGSDCRA
jgi:hypothetical protein